MQSLCDDVVTMQTVFSRVDRHVVRKADLCDPRHNDNPGKVRTRTRGGRGLW